MKKQFGVVHGIASCRTCSWSTQSYKNAQAIAVKHAKDKKHVVVGEVGYAFVYDGSQKE